MTTQQADGHWPKIIRAEEHLGSIRGEIDYYREGNPCKAVGKFESDGEYVIRIQKGQPPSPRLALLIGDCFASMRSALDHLAFALAAKHTPARVTDPNKVRGIYFPIYETEKTPKGRDQDFRGVEGVPDIVLSAIKAGQPYTAGAEAASHPLAVISELNNRDKHRQLMLTSFFLDGLGVFGVTCNGIPLGQKATFTALAEGDEAARLPLTIDHVKAAGGTTSDDLSVFAMAPMQVTFSEPGPCYGRPVLTVLDECLAFLRPFVSRVATVGGMI